MRIEVVTEISRSTAMKLIAIPPYNAPPAVRPMKTPLQCTSPAVGKKDQSATSEAQRILMQGALKSSLIVTTEPKV